MSLFLKSVWRGMLRPLVRSPLTVRSLASNVSESPAQTPDALMTMIRGANTTVDVLECVQLHLPYMTHHHLLHALRCLFQLHKADPSGNIQNKNLLKDPTFGLLCQNFKKHARSLDVSEAIEATKVLIFLGVSVDAFILQTMLQMIRAQINLLNIQQIMFVDFLLSRFDTSNHLVDALKLALPLAFQIQLPMELGQLDLAVLRDTLSYCCIHDLPDRFIDNIVTELLRRHKTINAQVAKSIIWSLCQVNCNEELNPTRVKLLHICYDILTDQVDVLTYNDVLKTAAKIKGRILEKHDEYYHEQLFDALANYVVNNKVDFESSLLVGRVLSRIAHTNLRLCEYLCSLASEDEVLSKSPTNVLFGFVNCLSNNNYIPPEEKFLRIKNQISENLAYFEEMNSTLPWVKFCLELASIGHYEDKLLQKIFSKEYLDAQLSKKNITLDYLQLFTLHEAVNTFHSEEYKLPAQILNQVKELYPIYTLTDQMQKYLAEGLGDPEYVAKNVQLPNGVVADLLLYLKDGYPMTLNRKLSPYKFPYEDLQLDQGGIPVCIMNFNQGCFSLNSNRLRGTFRLLLDILEKQGYVVVPVNVTQWLAAPAHERAPYLLREIGYKCGEIGMTLHAS